MSGASLPAGVYHRGWLVAPTAMDTTLCPECGGLAEVLWRQVAESTDGPVEHAKISLSLIHI